MAYQLKTKNSKLRSEFFLFPFFYFSLAAAGFLFPFWPLSALAIVLAGARGRPGMAVLFGIFFDLVWGAPPGFAGALFFPFALLALVVVFVRLLANRFVFLHPLPERLY